MGHVQRSDRHRGRVRARAVIALSRLLKHLREFNLTVVCFALSAIALGRALQINLGFYSEDALWWLTAALIASTVGVVLHRAAPPVSRVSAGVWTALLAAGLAWQFYQLYTSKPGLYLRDDASLTVFRTGIVAQAVCIACGVLNIRPLRRFWFPGLLAASLFLGVWM